MNLIHKKSVLAPVLLMLLAVVAQVAYAADVPTPATILAATPAGDKSIEIFKHLLGDFFTNPLATAASTPTLIGGLFLVFNSAIFVVAMLWASFGLISGIVETANTGEVLGKRLSAVWLPIRMVTGIAGIVPVFGGFSLSQVFIISMTSLGIGIANGMWVKAVDAINEFATLSPPVVMASDAGGSLRFEAAAENLFLMHVCRLSSESNAAAMAAVGAGAATNEIARATPISGDGRAGLAISSANVANICGRVEVKRTQVEGRKGTAYGFRVASVDYDAFAKQVVNAYTSRFPAFNSEVAAIAAKWYAERGLAQATPATAVTSYPKEALNSAAQNYALSVQSTTTAVGEGVKSRTTALKGEAAARMREMGWIGAGAWYSTFAEANAAMADAMKSVSYTFDPPSLKDLENRSPAVLDDINGIQVSRQANPATSESESNATASANEFGVVAAWLCNNVLPSSMCTATGNVSLGQAMVKKSIDAAAVGSGGGDLINPIIMFKNLGDTTMGVAESIFAVQAAVSMAGEFLPGGDGAESAKDAHDTTVMGPAKSKGLLAKIGGGLTKVVLWAVKGLWSALTIIAPYMLILGMLMAIYIPMVPFITWMGGVVQYAVVVCQGLVGAPIAALSHMEAEGEGLGRRTEAGYMFVLNVTFRPALMLFGFLLASALMIATGTLQAKLFVGAMSGAQGNSLTGFMSFIGFLTIFFMINVTLIQGLFNMIFLLPDQVLGLIGNHGHMADIGKETEHKIHAVFMNFGSKIQNLATSPAARQRPPASGTPRDPGDPSKGGGRGMART